MYIKTSDGSWDIDYSYLSQENGSLSAEVSTIDAPAGTFTSFYNINSVEADSGNQSDHQLNIVQLRPSPGSMIWHAAANAGTQACHLSVQYFPETMSTVAGATPATAGASSHLPIHLGPQ